MVWVGFQLLVGLVCLVAGGELLVRGASALASAMRISPLVIGLTVVAFGTSAPELGVSLQAAFADAADLAIGNVVGSNILNVLLILGLAALITPLTIASQLIRLDVPLMIGASLLLWGFGMDGRIARWEGGLLFACLVTYVVISVRQSRRESREVVEEFAKEIPKAPSSGLAVLGQIGLIVVGLLLLALGSKSLVTGAISIAQYLGASELLIGLTIVSMGTSLPEIVTSVLAGLRGERDIAVGNVVGSNIFNILCVLGLCGTVAPSGVPVSGTALAFDIPIMVAVAVICLPIFITGQLVARWEGGLFLSYYVIYTAILITVERRPNLLDNLTAFLGIILLPVTLITILLSLWNSWLQRKPAGGS